MLGKFIVSNDHLFEKPITIGLTNIHEYDFKEVRHTRKWMQQVMLKEEG